MRTGADLGGVGSAKLVQHPRAGRAKALLVLLTAVVVSLEMFNSQDANLAAAMVAGVEGTARAGNDGTFCVSNVSSLARDIESKFWVENLHSAGHLECCLPLVMGVVEDEESDCQSGRSSNFLCARIMVVGFLKFNLDHVVCTPSSNL